MTHEQLPIRSLSGQNAVTSFVSDDFPVGWPIFSFSQITIAAQEVERIKKEGLIKTLKKAQTKYAELEDVIAFCAMAYGRDLALAEAHERDHPHLAEAIKAVLEAARIARNLYLMYGSAFPISDYELLI